MIIRKEMNDQERKIFLRLWANDNRTVPILHSIFELHHKRIDQIFRFMIRKGIVGKHLFELSESNNHAPWRIVQSVIQRMDGQMTEPLNQRDFN